MPVHILVFHIKFIAFIGLFEYNRKFSFKSVFRKFSKTITIVRYFYFNYITAPVKGCVIRNYIPNSFY